MARRPFEPCMIDASLSSLLALLAGCALMGVAFAIPSLVAIVEGGESWASGLLGGLASAVSFFVVALVVGFLPTLLVGAPLYGLLRYIDRDRYWTAGLIGLVIGLVAWGFALKFAPFTAWLLVPPTVVALLTHRFSLLWRSRR